MRFYKRLGLMVLFVITLSGGACQQDLKDFVDDEIESLGSEAPVSTSITEGPGRVVNATVSGTLSSYVPGGMSVVDAVSSGGQAVQLSLPSGEKLQVVADPGQTAALPYSQDSAGMFTSAGVSVSVPLTLLPSGLSFATDSNGTRATGLALMEGAGGWNVVACTGAIPAVSCTAAPLYSSASPSTARVLFNHLNPTTGLYVDYTAGGTTLYSFDSTGVTDSHVVSLAGTLTAVLVPEDSDTFYVAIMTSGGVYFQEYFLTPTGFTPIGSPILRGSAVGTTMVPTRATTPPGAGIFAVVSVPSPSVVFVRATGAAGAVLVSSLVATGDVSLFPEWKNGGLLFFNSVSETIEYASPLCLPSTVLISGVMPGYNQLVTLGMPVRTAFLTGVAGGADPEGPNYVISGREGPEDKPIVRSPGAPFSPVDLATATCLPYNDSDPFGDGALCQKPDGELFSLFSGHQF